MLLVEFSCACIVVIYLLLRLQRTASPRAVLERLGLVMVASFIGEDSVIRAYHFYGYSRGWHLFLDQVPLMIVVIWPIVIDSAWVLAHRVAGGGRRFIPWIAAAFVLADASLIEPIAVRAGLWSWSEPGLFGVPPVGILGWAFFTFAAVSLVERAGAVTMLLAPLATHAMLLVGWWGALRWVAHPIGSWTAATSAWAILLPTAVLFWTLNLRARVPARDLWCRLPGALFFFVLLAAQPSKSGALPMYAAAFVPPYLALWRRS
jgi:hypothetical protein